MNEHNTIYTYRKETNVLDRECLAGKDSTHDDDLFQAPLELFFFNWASKLKIFN